MNNCIWANRSTFVFWQHIIPQHTDPASDPSHQPDMMVHIMGQEVFSYPIILPDISELFNNYLYIEVFHITMQEAAHYKAPSVYEQLPDISDFVAAERDSIPLGNVRLTTALTRGRGNATGKGKKRTSNVDEAGTSTRGTRAASSGTGGGSRGASAGTGGGRRGASSGTQGGRRGATAGTGRGRRGASTGMGGRTGPSGGTEGRTRAYGTGPGTAFHLLFGDEEQEQIARRAALPDLNENVQFDEVQISQNAPH
jgi:hypothetical protein